MNKRPGCSRLCAKSDDQLKYEQEQCSMPVPVLNVLWQQPEPGSEHLLVCPETNFQVIQRVEQDGFVETDPEFLGQEGCCKPVDIARPFHSRSYFSPFTHHLQCPGLLFITMAHLLAYYKYYYVQLAYCSEFNFCIPQLVFFYQTT